MSAELPNDKHFYSHAPQERVKPPRFPARPDLFDEVEWGPYVTPDDAKLAHRLWELPNNALGSKVPEYPRFPVPETFRGDRDIRGMHALANNVYEHLMENHTRPPTKEESDQIWRDTTREKASWTIRTIFAPLPERRAQIEPILIHGHDVLSSPYWTVARLREELRNRGLSDAGRSADLRRRLHDHECGSRGHSFLPRSNLSHWGVEREDNFTFKLSETRALKPLDMYTWAILLSPYNPTYWLSRAYCHYQQAFYDLAIGDAYRAMLLSGVLADARERNRQPGLYPRIWNAIEQHVLAKSGNLQSEESKLAINILRCPNGINSFMPTLRKALHNIISLSLAALGNWREYGYMEHYLKERLIMAYRDTGAFDRRQRVLAATSDDYQKKRNNKKLFFYEKAAGNADGAADYPYEAGDKDRTASMPLDLMNRNLFKNFPKCEVKAGPDDNSLSVVATEDIKKGALIFAEEPSIRGHLAKKRRPDDTNWTREKKPRCENCRKVMDDAALRRYNVEADAIKNGTHPEACECALLRDNEPLYFCSKDQGQDVSCMEVARKLYHYRACGKNWMWLHDSMRPMITKWGEFLHYPHLVDLRRRPASRISYTNEVATTVLSLLLRDVFDITLMRRDRTGDANLMAHEIDELFMLEDPKSWDGSWFPFTLVGNIQVPFDILLQLGVDIFRDLTFDTWVIQTVMRKLMVNVVPWDKKWRGSVERIGKWDPVNNTRQRNMVERGESFKRLDPSFETLYLFSGFSLFNHACRGHHNALWGYDEVVPNRVVVWAAKDIPKSTEVLIPYKHKQMTKNYALRVLGKHCQCSLCQHRPLDEEWNADEGSEDDDDDEDNDGYGGGNGYYTYGGGNNEGHTGGNGSGDTSRNTSQKSNNGGQNRWGIGGNPNKKRSPTAVTSKVLPGINSTGMPLVDEEIDNDQSPNYEPPDNWSTSEDDEEYEIEATPPIKQNLSSHEHQWEPGPAPPPSAPFIPPPRFGGYPAAENYGEVDAQALARAQAQAALNALSPQQQQQQSRQYSIRGLAAAQKRKRETKDDGDIKEEQ